MSVFGAVFKITQNPSVSHYLCFCQHGPSHHHQTKVIHGLSVPYLPSLVYFNKGTGVILWREESDHVTSPLIWQRKNKTCTITSKALEDHTLFTSFLLSVLQSSSHSAPAPHALLSSLKEKGKFLPQSLASCSSPGNCWVFPDIHMSYSFTPFYLHSNYNLKNWVFPWSPFPIAIFLTPNFSMPFCWLICLCYLML